MFQFLKQILASLIGSLAGLMLFFALGASSLVLLLISTASQEQVPTIKKDSVLVLDLSTQIRDQEPPSNFASALSEDLPPVISLRQLLQLIDKAAKDDRIVGLFLDGSRLLPGGNGYATLQEVRAALEEFQESGKEIIAYNVSLNESAYYLTSVADTVILNPMGEMEINGLGSEPMFLAGAFEKYGIGVQVVRVGSYKGAVEPFIRENLSPENRQQMEVLLGDLWQEFVSTVASSRDLTPQRLQSITDNQGILLPDAAKNAGLVDKVAYFDEVVTQLQALTGEEEDADSFRKVSLNTYQDVPLKEVKKQFSENKVAVVYAEGGIVNGEGELGEIGSSRYAAQLRKLRQDEDIQAVVLRINSPGGSATASEIILRELQLLQEEKPVVISMGNIAASGGYWIATGGDRIFAEPTTITGSIGVFGLLPNIQKLANDNGITWDIVKTGQLADIFTATRPKTEKELSIYQGFVNQVYDQFLDKVAESRGLPRAQVANIAQGRVWSGKEAKRLGLVDELGGIEEAIAYAIDQAELEDDWEIEEYPKQRSFEEEILERLLDQTHLQPTQSTDPLLAQWLKLKREFSTLQQLDDPKGIYLRLPFNLEID